MSIYQNTFHYYKTQLTLKPKRLTVTGQPTINYHKNDLQLYCINDSIKT